MRVRKAHLIVFCGVLGITLLLAMPFPACAGGSTEVEGVPELKLLYYSNLARNKQNILDKHLLEYEELTGVKIETDGVPYAQLHEKMILDFASRGGVYDVVICLTDWFPELAGGEFLLPLNNYVEKDPPEDWPNAFPQALLELQTQDGKIYGLPCHDGPIMTYYRKDLFNDIDEKTAFKSQYGYDLAPPETWDQFVDVVRFFNRPDEGLHGTVLACKGGGQQLVYDFFLMLWSFGGEIFDSSMHPVFNSKEGIDALQLYVDLVNKWQVIPRASSTYDQSETGPVYLNGNAAIMWNWSHIAAYAELPDRSKIVGNNAISLFPVASKGMKHTTLEAYWFFAISSASRHKEESYKLIKWLTSKERDKEAAFAGAIGCRMSTFRDPEILAKFPFYADIEKTLASGYNSVPRIPEYARITDIIGVACSQAIAGEVSVKEALDDASKQVEAVMKEAGYFD